jgi:hypothetical protein
MGITRLEKIALEEKMEIYVGKMGIKNYEIFTPY